MSQWSKSKSESEPGDGVLGLGLGATQWDDSPSAAAAAPKPPEPPKAKASVKSAVHKPKDIEASAAYHAKRPSLPYSSFEREFVDEEGREYMLPPPSDFVDAQDNIDNEDFDATSLLSGGKAGRLLLYLRMPIRHRYSTPLPDPEGERLRLYHIRTQVLCSCTTDGVFVTPRARTGHVFVRDFESKGQVADPRRYERWLEVNSREPGNNWF